MTEDLIATGREAGFCITDSLETIVGNKTALEAYTALVVARTREECASLCDGQAALWKHPKYHYAQAVGNHCAAAIRALGERT